MGLDTYLYIAGKHPSNELINIQVYTIIKELYSWRNNTFLRDYFEKKYKKELNNYYIKLTEEDISKIRELCLNDLFEEKSSSSFFWKKETLEGFSLIRQEQYKAPDNIFDFYILQSW